jgi:hypothetical protein
LVHCSVCFLTRVSAPLGPHTLPGSSLVAISPSAFLDCIVTDWRQSQQAVVPDFSYCANHNFSLVLLPSVSVYTVKRHGELFGIADQAGYHHELVAEIQSIFQPLQPPTSALLCPLFTIQRVK